MTEPSLPPPPRTNVVLAFFGWVILLVGVLIAGLAGICTLTFLPAVGGGNQLSGLALVLIVGGIPIAVGVGLVFAGIAMLKAARPSQPPIRKTFE